jgi:ABC-2 type transport system permease protein
LGLAAAYPVFAAFGLGAAGIGLALTLMLVRWLGARRARVVAQILSGVLGASFFLAWQIPNMMPRDARERLISQLNEMLGSGWLGPDSVLWWPLRALFGDPLPALAIVAGGVALFVVVVRITRETFLAGTQEAASASKAVQTRDAVFAFRRGLVRGVITKELKLIARDPNLIAQTLLQALYIVPLLFLLMRQSTVFTLLGPVMILMLAQVAGNLAWITVAGEEAPDLVGSAPVDRGKVRWLKALAALLPPAAVGVPVALLYLTRSPRLALVFAAFLAIALAAAAVVQVWAGKPAPHRDLKQRQKQNIGINLLEFLSVAGIAAACFLAMTGSWWSFAVLVVGLIAPVSAFAMRRSDETT